MATDTLAMSLLIRLMPLMQREFALRVDPGVFFADEGYREAVLGSALEAAEPRLRGYAEQLRQRLTAIGYGSPGALRSAANARVERPQEFEQTAPGALGAVSPALRRGVFGAAASAPATPAPAPQAPAEPGTPPATPPDEPGNPARKYIGRLR
jgi:hypothetical protein